MNSPSPVHFHSGDLSGVLYLKVTEIANEPAEEMKPKVGGFLHLPGLAAARRRAVRRQRRAALARLQRIRDGRLL